MDNLAAQSQLTAIGPGNKVYLQGHFDFQNSITSRYAKIVSIDTATVIIQSPTLRANQTEVIRHQAITHISLVPPYKTFESDTSPILG
ncbi:hypothetical protein [Pseudomonas sp. HMWF006]|uniref:hypothetical protein n=1 Tax=Pseudomonas sp. HMWF006 TaxID=2056843 RepID=UPI000D3F477D|nr:hypothetical protein [Pseudomonas sp. HMWF006]PTS94234.1 hypothetical protein DBR24_24835 [Pseudomonas sp. HMWF006]PTT67118.1 hypothetical protein DBR26_16020 [Pseudomonas sp. HMWF007]PTT79731.1 hypothetical protein DBR29_30420 [Pseudomonas sp. HMWF005]